MNFGKFVIYSIISSSPEHDFFYVAAVYKLQHLQYKTLTINNHLNRASLILTYGFEAITHQISRVEAIFLYINVDLGELCFNQLVSKNSGFTFLL